MRTEPIGTEAPRAVPRDGVHVLVAVGSSPADRRVVQGELVWLPEPCGRPRCSCASTFIGSGSHGMTDFAQVTTMPLPRTELRRALEAGMCPDCFPPALAGAAADRLLDIAQGLPAGTLVRLKRGVVKALPPGSRVTRDGVVVPPRSGR